MRTIKFRGKRVDNGEWEEGFVIEYEYGTAILNINSLYHVDGAEWNFNDIQVIPETVGQFTGLSDKNGKEIFEGDFCKDAGGRILEVGWSDKFASFVLKNQRWAFKHWFGESCESEEVEVIGNIHDNPELL